jgi:hypothetical protein
MKEFVQTQMLCAIFAGVQLSTHRNKLQGADHENRTPSWEPLCTCRKAFSTSVKVWKVLGCGDFRVFFRLKCENRGKHTLLEIPVGMGLAKYAH